MNKQKKSQEIQRLLEAFAAVGQTVEEVAEKTGVAERTLQNLIYGDLPIGGALLRGLVEAYAISADWLLTGRGSLFIGDDEADKADNPLFLVPYFQETDQKDAGDAWVLAARAAEAALQTAGAVPGDDYGRLDLFTMVAPLVFKMVERQECRFFAREQSF